MADHTEAQALALGHTSFSSDSCANRVSPCSDDKGCAVHSLEVISAKFGMNPLIFALLLAPVAIELPEKFNSVTWTWKGRDTLALGNITGAIVFQSTFPVSVGLLYTEWNITDMVLFSAVLAITSAAAVLSVITVTKRISPFVMLFGGVLYLLYAGVLIFR